MNYIDITQNKHTVCHRNNVVVVTKKVGIQGPPGRDGNTPYINRETFTWMIGSIDTGVKALGKDGDVPYINEENIWCIGDVVTGVVARGVDGQTPFIDEDTFHWCIGDYDTGIIAKGYDGITPHIGENNHWFIGDLDTGLEAGIKREEIAVLEKFDTLIHFPLTGNPNHIYVALDTNNMYRYDEETISYIKFDKSFDLDDASSMLDLINMFGLVMEGGDSTLREKEDVIV